MTRRDTLDGSKLSTSKSAIFRSKFTYCILYSFISNFRSLKKTLARDKTMDKGRAQRLLEDELASIASKEYHPENPNLRDIPRSSSLAPITTRETNYTSALVKPSPRAAPELNILSQMISNRNQLYCEPFDVFDPMAPLRGVRRFNENFRPLRSKINLKITAEEA